MDSTSALARASIDGSRDNSPQHRNGALEVGSRDAGQRFRSAGGKVQQRRRTSITSVTIDERTPLHDA